MFVIVVSVSTGAVVIDHRKRETHNVKCIEVNILTTLSAAWEQFNLVKVM